MDNRYLKALSVLASAAIVSGCAGMAAETDTTSTQVSTTSAELAASQQRINELESALAAKESDLAAANARAASGSSSDGSAITDGSLFPPNPKPGECYARVLIPAKVETFSEQVMTREASERIEIIPARYETATESVLVKEASTRL